jgi:hypothetical protein
MNASPEARAVRRKGDLASQWGDPMATAAATLPY